MPLKSGLITLPFTHERPSPPFEGDDIRFPEGLVRYFIKAATRKGAKVFDPFTGLGTTLFVAEEAGRIPYGVETDPKRHAWVAGQLKHWQHLVHADVAKLAAQDFPQMDFCMTSPPYMPRHHKWNPLFSGNPKHAGYDRYLRRMEKIFMSVAKIMKPGAWVVVQADNLDHGRIHTPLVRDLGLAISKSLAPAGESIVRWHPAKPGHTHTHCLLFKRV